jgi:hypothetical protein
MDVADRSVGNRKLGLFLIINNIETDGSERQFTNVPNAPHYWSFEVRLGWLRRIGIFVARLQKSKSFGKARVHKRADLEGQNGNSSFDLSRKIALTADLGC